MQTVLSVHPQRRWDGIVLAPNPLLPCSLSHLEVAALTVTVHTHFFSAGMGSGRGMREGFIELTSEMVQEGVGRI